MKYSFEDINVSKPVLLLDERRCKRNIARMVKKAKQAGCMFRPHFKTHQSIEIGRWFRDAGVTGITVSSTSMARYFATDGWNDITIAFPFFPAMLENVMELQKKSALRLFIHSPGHIQLLDKNLNNSIRFYIEIDPGYGRSGVAADDHHRIEEIIEAAETSKNCHFHGFYIHDGRTYEARNTDDITKIILPSADALINLKKQYPEAVINLEDTPSASRSSVICDLDEITPGNFVFYDLTQTHIGSCTVDDMALFVLLPVAQVIHPHKAILHGGAAHLSKDWFTMDNTTVFGQCADYSKNDKIRFTDGHITALSQEHGTLITKNTILKDDSVVCICPVHSCLTANLFRYYYLPDGTRIEKRILS